MEIESEDGSRIALQSGSKTLFGRGSGFETADRTVSRRHLILETAGPSHRASFEVLGRNPVWVRRGDENGIRVFKRSDKGELLVGDWFCVGGQQPVWFGLKGVETEKSERDSGSDTVLAESVDVSDMDPVKEFGFVVMGHEFDSYPKKMLRQVKDWEWFLEEPRKKIDSDDEDEDEEKKVRRSNKRKKRGRDKEHGDEEDNDEEWMGESEDETMDDLAKVNKVRERKYSTRSNDPKRRGIKRNLTQKRDSGSQEEEEEEDDEEDDNDEDDDTLGGFIVKDDDAEVEEETSDVEEEEELIEDGDDEWLD